MYKLAAEQQVVLEAMVKIASAYGMPLTFPVAQEISAYCHHSPVLVMKVAAGIRPPMPGMFKSAMPVPSAAHMRQLGRTFLPPAGHILNAGGHALNAGGGLLGGLGNITRDAGRQIRGVGVDLFNLGRTSAHPGGSLARQFGGAGTAGIGSLMTGTGQIAGITGRAIDYQGNLLRQGGDRLSTYGRSLV